MRIEQDLKLDYDDVLIRPKRSTLGSRADVKISRVFNFKNSGQRYMGVPIMAANMDGVGTIEMATALAGYSMFTCLSKFVDIIKVYEEVDKNPSLLNHLAYTTGISDNGFFDLQQAMKEINFRYICLDVANGYTEKFIDTVKRLRQEYPSTTLIAGNVVTADITEQLIYAGADIVKVGIGPGSACSTRLVTGVGYPQLSAVIECADAAHGLGGHIIADGGIAHYGDAMKAFGAGADFVMVGGMLAGCDEAGRDCEQVIKVGPDGENQYFIKFYGSSSETAMNKHHGGKADYRSSEGRTTLIPYRGAVKNIVEDLSGGIRSGMTYIGAKSLKEVSKRTTFIRVNNTHNRIYEKLTVGK